MNSVCRTIRLSFLLTMAVPNALLAKDDPPPAPQPMRVVIAHSAAGGCEPQCLEWISAQGAIDASTPGQFRKVLKAIGNRKLPVLVDSAGGRVDEALTIGRMIRAKGLDVIVTKTLFKPCEKTDAACKKLTSRDIHPALPQSRLSKCASSCAFLLAAGSRRFVGPATLVGLHQITSFTVNAKVLRTYRITTRYQFGVPIQQQKSLVSEKKIGETKQAKPTSDATYGKINAYFAEMGISQAVMPILMSAPSSSIRWLRSSELASTKLATDFQNGEQLLLPPKTAATAPIAAMPRLGFAGAPAPSFAGMPTCNPTAGVATNCVPSAENLPTPANQPATVMPVVVPHPADAAAPVAPVVPVTIPLPPTPPVHSNTAAPAAAAIKVEPQTPAAANPATSKTTAQARRTAARTKRAPSETNEDQFARTAL